MQNNNQKKPEQKKRFDIIFFILVILTIIGVFFLIRGFTTTSPKELNYDEFTEYVETGKIAGVVTAKPVGGENYGIYTITGAYNDNGKISKFTLNVTTQLLEQIYELDNIQVSIATISENIWASLLISLIPYAIFIGLFIFLMRGQGNNKAFDFGKSTAQLSRGKTVTFKDVAGCDEEKEELVEIIDFLKNPRKYNEIGARIPKGVLLFGPPGTGKTLLAKAVAGEAGVPFFSISGSDFVEMFVGVGASRVRDMFKTAKQNAPCIIFIDEIDAVGRQRGAGMGGGHDEREQTLNQMLVEMDGFNGNLGIIVMAATNRPDVLDPALLRPGRFDRQITISNPDVRGREAILKVHARNKHLEPTVKLDEIAQRIPGFSGADIENLLNEAALLAARANRKVINTYDIDEAIDRVMMGPAKKSKKYTEKERKLVAYHEAGHAVIGLRLENASVVQKVTIVPRGQAGGYNLMMPKEETYFRTKTDLLDTICGFLGGRIAEEIMFDEVTTGAQNDIERATKIARAMVTEYGMSSLGLLQLETQEGSVFLGRDYNKSRNFSSQVAYEIDQEMRKILDECYERATKIIKDNKKLLDLIANALLEHETLTKEQIEYLVENGCMPDDDNEIDASEFKEASLNDLTEEELKDLAKEKGIDGYINMTKEELIKELED